MSIGKWTPLATLDIPTNKATIENRQPILLSTKNIEVAKDAKKIEWPEGKESSPPWIKRGSMESNKTNGLGDVIIPLKMVAKNQEKVAGKKMINNSLNLDLKYLKGVFMLKVPSLYKASKIKAKNKKMRPKISDKKISNQSPASDLWAKL